MLPLLLFSFVVHAGEVKEARSDVFAVVGVGGGLKLVDLEPGARGGRQQPGPGLGARVGFRASVPPAIPEGARVGLMPMLVVRHDPVGGRTEWLGDASLTLVLRRLMIAVSFGYGLSSVRGADPHPVLNIGSRLSFFIWGGLMLGVGLDSSFRLESGGRALEVSLCAGWQFELFE